MLYVRQETEDVYTPLHLVPPTVHGLISAIENKYKINASNIRFLYRKNKDGIVAKIDDDMLRHYCNEDVFLMQVCQCFKTLCPPKWLHQINRADKFLDKKVRKWQVLSDIPYISPL